MLEPITAGLFSYIFLNEVMEPLQLAGAVLVIFAIILLQLKQEFDDKTPAMIRAAKDDKRLRENFPPGGERKRGGRISNEE